MAGLVPEDIVQRIKDESDIAMVISDFVGLKKSGKDFKGLCPFHQEKTPSFYVIPSKGFYHCFGCGKGGNVVNFIMDHERLDYPDALRYLASKAGITIPETGAGRSESEKLFEALELAASFFRKTLLKTPDGKAPLEYLKSRGMSDATIELFGFGYAPNSWDSLIKEAAAKKIQPAVLEKAGLVNKKQGYFDRFRHRITLPIKALSGKTVAFGARIMPGQEGPKYINSPETEIYKKGRILFGFDIARNYIREKNQAVVVEGYFDLISLRQAGIANVVAVSGTGFTGEQAALLARFCEQVTLLYDSDSAGIKAAFRACGVLYNSGIEPRLIRLPKGYDPDSFVREKGPDELMKMVDSAADVVEFVHKGINGKFGDQPLSRQEKIIKALSETAGLIEDNVRRELLISKIADKFDIQPSHIERKTPPRETSSRVSGENAVSGRDKFERAFLGFIISHPEIYPSCQGIVDRSLFSEEGNAAIFDMLGMLISSGKEVSVSDLFDKVGVNGLRGRLSDIVSREPSSAGWESVFEDHLRRFMEIAARRKLDEIKRLIGEAERQSDSDKIEKLTREFQNLKSEVEANDA